MAKIADFLSVILPFLLIFLFTDHGKNIDTAFYLGTPELVESWGYPIEIHNVTTDDGFILELHRIPYGIHSTTFKNKTRPVIFLQHGFLGSSFEWVANSPSQSAAFVFADAGFDVWMGNFRGNTYSRRHIRYNPDKDMIYWDWSWDQISQYDIPAMIAKVRNETRQDSVYYIGHSLGTLSMFSKLSKDIHFSKYIKRFFALAPIGTVQHVRGTFTFFAKHLGVLYQKHVRRIGGDELFGSAMWFKNLIKNTCGMLNIFGKVCSDITLSFVGMEHNNWNRTRLPVYLSHCPAGSSSNILSHFIQMHINGGISSFDMGNQTNIDVYNQDRPPVYNFSRIDNIPIYLFWSHDDWLSTYQDIKQSIIDVIKPGIIQKSIEIPKYNHLDFIWGTNAPFYVYNPIIELIISNDYIIDAD